MASFALTSTFVTEEINSSPVLAALGHLWNGGYETWYSPNLTYTLNVSDSNPANEAVGEWSVALTAATERAHADIEAVSMITFTEVADQQIGSDGADVDYWAYSAPSDNAPAFPTVWAVPASTSIWQIFSSQRHRRVTHWCMTAHNRSIGFRCGQ